MNPFFFTAGACAAAVLQWPLIALLQKTESLPGVLALTAAALLPPWFAALAVTRRAHPAGESAVISPAALKMLRLAGWGWLALSALRIFLTDSLALSGPEPAFWLCLTTAIPPYCAALWLRIFTRSCPYNC
ncbi:MAG: hypothetical protein KatS3mg024_2583 [Armatimonadota bacterium]|nr:MAG: hypothetical protein KatS3mg024_2583 [Armatimonadota bacterium]